MIHYIDGKSCACVALRRVAVVWVCLIFACFVSVPLAAANGFSSLGNGITALDSLVLASLTSDMQNASDDDGDDDDESEDEDENGSDDDDADESVPTSQMLTARLSQQPFLSFAYANFLSESTTLTEQEIFRLIWGDELAGYMADAAGSSSELLAGLESSFADPSLAIALAAEQESLPGAALALSAVPEPSAWLLAPLGLLPWMCRRWR